eukprot:s1536_g3.t1
MAEGGEEGCRLARDPELQKEILELLKTWIEGQDLSFRMAEGGEEGCRLARDPELQKEILELLKTWIEGQDLSEPGLLEIPEGQPLRLRLLRAILEAADDPDRDYLRLPRTPHVFEEQTSWRLDKDSWEPALAWVPNYASIEDHKRFVRAKFEEDVQEDLMEKMTLGEFKARFGENRAITSLAVIVEDEEKDKKRIIHDATHGVRASEHGFMGCQIDGEETVDGDPDSQIVYVNKVGTFGLSPASYWWTRIAACGIRATHHLLGPGYPMEMLLYADDLEALGIGARGRQGIPLCYLFLSVLGYPFKWAKTRGGYCVEWLGMETDYSCYKLGLSAQRAAWLSGWLREKATAGRIEAKEVQQGLGRLGFAAIALDWERPFLGPLHAWSAAIPGRPGGLVIPTMLRVLMGWIADRLDGGGRLQRPVSLHRRLPPLSFFTDAQAESDSAWIGGFLEVIAALELLATLVGIRLWVPEGEDRKTSRVAIRGYTDNKSNEALLKKAMTTKYPSMLVLMEIAEELAHKNCELQLQWIRRELNQLADDLTNEDFHGFDPGLRIDLKGGNFVWRILDRLLVHSDSFYKELGVRKREAPARLTGIFATSMKKRECVRASLLFAPSVVARLVASIIPTYAIVPWRCPGDGGGHFGIGLVHRFFSNYVSRYNKQQQRFFSIPSPFTSQASSQIGAILNSVVYLLCYHLRDNVSAVVCADMNMLIFDGAYIKCMSLETEILILEACAACKEAVVPLEVRSWPSTLPLVLPGLALRSGLAVVRPDEMLVRTYPNCLINVIASL